MSKYIGISTPTFDLSGNLLFKADITATELKNMNRRVSRSATLDGGVSIIDSGFAHGDRTFNIVANLTETQCTRLEYITQNYSEIILAVPEGIFSANLKSYQNHYGNVRLEILVNEKLAPIAAPVYYCAFDETFHDLAYWYITTQHGTETATIVASGLDRECRLDLPDSLDTEIRLLYQYLIPVGDFDILLDVNEYTPDNSLDGFWLAFRIRSSDELYYAEVRVHALSSPPNLYTIVTEFREDAVYTTSPLASEYPLEAIRITRVGNEITLTYHNNSWYIGDVRDFGAHSSDLDRIEIIAYDSGTRGGTVDVDNLVFRSGCPSGYPKAWSTTTTSSTSTCSSTLSSTSTSSTFSTSSTTTSTTTSTSSTTTSTTTSTSSTTSSTSSTTSTTSSTTSTTSTTSSSLSTTSTLSTSSSTSSCSSTASTLSTTTSTLSSSTTTTTYWCDYNETFTGLEHWQVSTNGVGETASIVAGTLRLDIPDTVDGFVNCIYQYLIASGDFSIDIDFVDYVPDDDNPGFITYFDIRDAIGAPVDQVFFYYNVSVNGTQHNLTQRMRVDSVNTDSNLTPAGRPTKYRVTRIGNIVTAYYYLSSWNLIQAKDFGVRAANLDTIYLRMFDNGLHGGHSDWDNLIFHDGCPDGYPKAWTTTSTTTTTSTISTTTTLSTTTSTNTSSCSTTTTASTASTTSTLSSTSSTTSSTASTLSTTSTISSSSSTSTTTGSTLSTTSTTCTTSTSTTTCSSTSSTSTTTSTTSTLTTSSSTLSSSSTSSTSSTLSTTSSTASTQSTTTTIVTTSTSTTASTSSTSSTISTLSTTTSTASTVSTTSSTFTTTTTSSTSSTQSTLSSTSSSTTCSSTTSSTISTLSTTTSTTHSTSTCSSTSSTASTLSTTSTTTSSCSSSSSTASTLSTSSTTTSTHTTSSTSSSTTSTHTSSSSTTTTTYWCDYNETFEDIDAWKIGTSGSGETATISGNKLRLDIPDTVDGYINCVYQYLIPSGNFTLDVDFVDYVPDDDNPGFIVYFDIRDAIGAPVDQVFFYYNVTTNGTQHNLTQRMRVDSVNTDDDSHPAGRPTKFRVVRSGTTLYAYYYLSGWNLIQSKDFGSRSDNPDTIYIRMFDNNLHGGHCDWDNLIFKSGCPAGYPKAWTTTSTTTTTCTTTSTAPP